jgi:hypothetical protein
VFSLGAAPERRRRPRWLTLILPVTAGLVVLALLGWLVGAALGGRSAGPGPTAAGGSTNPGTTAAAAAPLRPVKPVADALFDPGGDKNETKDIAASTDGNPETSWYTAHYRSRSNSTFGGLKPGIGIAYDFGKATALRQIIVTTDSPGIQIEIRAGNTPNTETSADGYAAVSAVQTMKDSSTFAIKKGTTARYYVVWLTQLSDDGGGFRGSLSEVTFKS